MKNLTQSRSGFSVVEVLIVVVVVVIAGLVAYKGYGAYTANKSTGSSSTSQASETQSLPTVESKSDLDAAQKTVENVQPDQLDTAPIDETLN